MKYTVSNNKKSKLLLWGIPVLVILLAAGAYIVFAVMNKDSPPLNNGGTSIDLNEPSDEQLQAGSDTKQSSIDHSGATDTPDEPQTNEATGKSTAKIFLTSQNQNGALMQLRFQIDDTVPSGKCALKLTNGSKTLSYEAEIQAISRVSTCKGFDVPINADSLTKGSWTAELSLISDTHEGNLSTNVTVQ